MCGYGQLVTNLMQFDLSVFVLNLFSSVQSFSHIGLFAMRLTAACQASLSITNSQSLLTHVHRLGDAIQPSHPVFPFSSCLQSFLTSVSFPMSQFFPSGGQIIGASASASVFPVNIQDWFFLGWTCFIPLQYKGLSRVFSNAIVQRAYMCVICQWHHIPPVGI